MDGDGAEQIIAVNGDEQQQQGLIEEQIEQFSSEEPGIESFDNVDDSAGYDNEIKHEVHRDSSSGKLFVGGIAWETTEETFTSYFSKYGEIIDSVIMMDKLSGRPRGFGFVTFADSSVADKVLEEDHVIDGRAVEVKRTVPRGDMQQVKGVSKTKKIFVGGIPPSFTEDELKDYFSSYGNIVEHQIMLDHQTGRSRGFGFVTFDSEDAVEKIFSDGKTHELGGKQVEIKKAEPRRAGGDYASDSRLHHAGGSSKSYGGFGRGGAEYGGGGYSRKTGRGNGGHGGYDGGYGGYDDSYGANYNGGSASFYGGYGGYGYGYGFGGPMYTGAGYGGRGYGNPAAYGGAGGYGGGKGYGSGGGNTSGYGGYDGAGAGYSGGRGYGGSGGYGGGGGGGGYGGGAGYGGGGGSGSGGYGGGKGYGNGGSATGRHHPYRK